MGRHAQCVFVLALQVEDEIQTLSQVLAAKERRLADIKKTLGVTPLNEFKQNISKTWQDLTASNAYVPDLQPASVCVCVCKSKIQSATHALRVQDGLLTWSLLSQGAANTGLNVLKEIW